MHGFLSPQLVNEQEEMGLGHPNSVCMLPSQPGHRGRAYWAQTYHAYRGRQRKPAPHNRLRLLPSPMSLSRDAPPLAAVQ